jgi:hypothetical protein
MTILSFEFKDLAPINMGSIGGSSCAQIAAAIQAQHSFCRRWRHSCEGEIWVSQAHEIVHVGLQNSGLAILTALLALRSAN